MLPDAQTFDATLMLVALSNIATPDDAPAAGLLLRSEDIGHKFGFNDGDAPEAVHDMMEAYLGKYRYIGNDTWHPILMDMVQTRLLPTLGNPDASLYLLDTNHNPIRWTNATHPEDFHPGEVYVPWAEVLTRVLMSLPQTST